MTMLSKEINKVKLFSLLVILATPFLSYSVTVQEIDKLYRDNYQQGTALSFDNILSLYNEISLDQTEELAIWGKLAVCSLLYNATIENEQKEQVKIYIKDVYKLLTRVKLNSIAPSTILEIAMLGFSMNPIVNDVKISFMDIYTLSKDRFRFLIANYSKTEYATIAKTMLAINLIFPSSITTVNWNTLISDTLTEEKINSISDPIISYQAHIWNSTFLMKQGKPIEAIAALNNAKKIYPNALLHTLIELQWSLGKDGF